MEKRMRWMRWLPALLLTCVLGTSRAEPPHVTAYQDAVQHALAAYEANDFESALTYFERAHQLAPSARTLRGLGLVQLELGRYREAVIQLEAALASTTLPLDAAMRDDVEQMRARALRSVAVLELSVQPAQAALRLNGWASASPSRHVLEPGEHVVEASASGYVAQRQALRLVAGEQRALAVTLVAEPVHAAPVVTRSWGPLWLGAASGAVAITGVGLLVAAKLKAHHVESATSGVWRDYAGDDARAPKLGRAGGVLLGVGAAGAAAGLTWRLLERRREHHDRRVSAALAPNGVQVTGSF